MDKRDDTAQIIVIMAGLTAQDPTGISAAIVMVLAAAVIINREFDP